MNNTQKTLRDCISAVRRRIPHIVFIATGIVSTIWFLIRVIPKPSRASYPCMRAAAPVMSGFIIYLLSLGGFWFFFRTAWKKMKQAKYLAGSAAIVGCIAASILLNLGNIRTTFSSTKGITWTRGVLPDGSNNPMGTARGIFPGRVVWAWNPAATNENCTNTMSNAYFMPKNNNQDTINKMADITICSIGGMSTVAASWDSIFKSFNSRKTGTARGYQEGETIFIKINNGQAGWAINMSTLGETGTTSEATGLQNAAMANTTPSAVLAYVRQLVDFCGIPQENIYIAEPMTHVYASMYDVITAEYPGVVILDKENHTNLGRTTSSGWTANAIKYSDKGATMEDAVSDALMNEMYNADYLINFAALKAHARAGVSLTAKLHVGSHGDHPNGYGYGSFYLHSGLIAVTNNDILNDANARKQYGMYRVLTDFMGHDKLGGNTLLFIVDGLWGGVEATDMAVKWGMAPFNNDWPSSLFVSQDGVAVESVCLDFLRAEATNNEYFKDRPFFPAVDDHLHQAADNSKWPSGFTYDPEGDGTPMPSMGIHEHWNNATKKQYSRNLGNEYGIELVWINHAPKVKTAIPNQTLHTANTSLQVTASLKNFFTDIDNDSLIFSAQSDSSMLEVSISNNSVLTIQAINNFTGPVFITVTAQDKESSVTTKFQVSFVPSGLSEYTIKDAISAWPNPIVNNLHLIFNEQFPSGETEISVYTIDGRIVHNEKVLRLQSDNEIELALGTLRPGNYILKATAKNQVAISKIAKQ